MRRILPLLMITLVTACATPDRSGPPEAITLPDQWRAGSGMADGSLDPWRASFADRRLTDVVTRVLNGNPDLEKAAAAIDRAVASAAMEGADIYPTLGASLSTSRQKQNFIGLPIPNTTGGVTSTTSDKAQGLLSASWELDVWGRVSAARNAATKQVEAARADYVAARLSLAGMGAKSYFALIESERQAALSLEKAKLAEESLFWTDRRYASGLLSADALRAGRQQASLARANTLLWEERRQTARRRLELLMGRYPEGGFTTDASLPTVTGALPAGLPADLLLRRPDLIAARARLEATDHRLRAARASLYPRLALTGSAGRSADEFSRLNDGDFSVWSLAANLTQPIFQGGRLAAGVDLADATVRQEAANWASTVLAAFDEVEGGLIADRISAERADALTDAADQSQAILETATYRHRMGIITYLDLLAARRSALEGISMALAAQRERLDRRVDLIVALGGGFAIDKEEK